MFSDKEIHILNWIKEVSQVREELNGFAICPFASNSKFKIIECNGKYNLILSQPTDKLKKFRKNLAKTSYYDMWDDEYLKEILEDDYDMIKTG